MHTQETEIKCVNETSTADTNFNIKHKILFILIIKQLCHTLPSIQDQIDR